MSRIAVFPGTFDPVTLGHLDLVQRALSIFDEVVVAVSQRGRSTLFDAPQRVELFRAAVQGWPRVRVVGFEGLIVSTARALGASALLRGVRGLGDWEAELQMAGANRQLSAQGGVGLETVFLPPSPGTARVSSSLVREVHGLGGDVSHWVPPVVLAALRQR